MKHIVKILSLLVAISAFWIGLLQAAIIPRSHTWLVSNKQFCPLFWFLAFLKLGFCSDLVLLPVCLTATDLLCCIPRMLWPINGWSRAHAVSYLPPRSSSAAEGTFETSSLFAIVGLVLIFHPALYGFVLSNVDILQYFC